MVASRTPWLVSPTVSRSGHRVALRRRFTSTRSASGTLMRNGRIAVDPPPALAASAKPVEASSVAPPAAADAASTSRRVDIETPEDIAPSSPEPPGRSLGTALRPSGQEVPQPSIAPWYRQYLGRCDPR